MKPTLLSQTKKTIGLTLFISLVLFVLAIGSSQVNAQTPNANGVIYVTTAGAGNKSGDSWANASDDLQMAINATNVQQVWVAKGTYKPKYRADNMSDANANDRDNAFVLKNNVKVYGGFAGTETTLASRILTLSTNASILSDDLGIVNTNTDNAYHVVISAGEVGIAELNGFTVKDGNANRSGAITVNSITIYQDSGGGIYNDTSSPVLTHVSISANTANDIGGGIYNASSFRVVLTHVAISANTATNGGGIYNGSSSPVLTNVSISANTATYGGGIYNYSLSSSVLTNVTISRNTASATNGGGGIYNDGTNSKPQIRNSIIFGNNTGIEGNGTPVVSYSLVQGSTDTNNGNIAGSTNPQFVDASTGDYSLKNTSPVINKGSDTFFATGKTPDLNAITTDIAGNTRIQKGNIDMGAYESPYSIPLAPNASGVIYVTQTGAGNKSGDSWANASDDLQMAINATNVQQVWVAKGTYKPKYRADNMSAANANDRNNAFVLKKDVQIYGGFAGTETALASRNLTLSTNASILSGDLGTATDKTDNAYHVVISSGDVGIAELNGFTVKDGNASGYQGITVGSTQIYQGFGGGIYNDFSSPVLTNVSINANTADYYGGGIYNGRNSSPVLTSVIISANTANDNGGGIYNGRNSSPVLTNVSISANTANDNGGGIYNEDIDSKPQIRNSIIYGNSSGIYGGTPVVSYSLVQGSTDTNNGNIAGSTDPGFVDASTGDYSLKNTSPLINKGNNTYFDAGQTPDLSAITTDIAGNTRIQKGNIDMGAYESPYNAPLAPNASGVIYVTATGAGSKTGNSWTNASDDLQMAINATNVQQVWVAAGEYQPASGQSFSMKEGVKIFGGFAATETTLAQRNWKTNVSILKGNGNRVINNNGLTTAAVLNGFTITGGSPGLSEAGGGILNNSSSPILTNLIIWRNNARRGGGIYNSSSSPILTNVIIAHNRATSVGGGMANQSSSPILSNVSIVGNNATSGGGGVSNSASNNSFPQIRNSIIWGNTSGIDGGGSVIKHSLVQDLTTADANGNIASGTDPMFVNASAAPELITADDYRLRANSPLTNVGSNSYFQAGQTPDLSGIITDLAGKQRIINDVIDLGAYEAEPLTADVNNILYVNKSVVGGTGTGDNWTNAISDLSDALLWAQQKQNLRTSANPLKIYIAKGTYKPLYNAADGQNTTDGGRDNAFVLSKNVKIYGGFDPVNNISTLLHQRIFGENGTILSGDIGIQNHNLDNVYHVVISAGNLGATLLDGLVIEEGRTENPGGVKTVVNGENIYRNAGAGFYNNGANNVLKNVLIRNNYSDGHGAGVYNDGASINQQPTHLLVSNSIISNNKGTGEGSFTCSGATATYLNTNFISNSGAAAQDSHNSTTNVYNSIWYNNGGGTASCTNSTKIGLVKNSIVVSLSGVNFELQEVREEPTNIMFEYEDVSYDDLFVLTGANPGINKGSNTAYTANGGDLQNDKDFANNSRAYGEGTIDIGAFEYQGNPVTLPITLISYAAKKNNNTAVLQWQTANEQNNKGFEVYRSGDDGVFVKLKEMAASQSYNYTFVDFDPLNGKNYYKLLQVDRDGTTTDLGVRALYFGLETAISVYPNPVTIKVFIKGDVKGNFIVYNGVGQKVAQGNATELKAGFNVSSLPIGIYHIVVEGKSYKMMKQ